MQCCRRQTHSAIVAWNVAEVELEVEHCAQHCKGGHTVQFSHCSRCCIVCPFLNWAPNLKHSFSTRASYVKHSFDTWTSNMKHSLDTCTSNMKHSLDTWTYNMKHSLDTWTSNMKHSLSTWATNIEALTWYCLRNSSGLAVCRDVQRTGNPVKNKFGQTSKVNWVK